MSITSVEGNDLSYLESEALRGEVEKDSHSQSSLFRLPVAGILSSVGTSLTYGARQLPFLGRVLNHFSPQQEGGLEGSQSFYDYLGSLSERITQLLAKNPDASVEELEEVVSREMSQFADPTKLTQLESPGDVSRLSVREWELNYALLCSAYDQTDDPKVKESIKFLIFNYLEKAAFLNSNQELGYVCDEEASKYQDMLQFGQLTMGGAYHRTTHQSRSFIDMVGLTKDLGDEKERGSSFFLMDHFHVEPLYRSGFHVAPKLSDHEEVVDFLVETMEEQIDKVPGENLRMPILFEITDEIGESLITEGDETKIKIYEEKRAEAKAKMFQVWKKAAEKLKEKYPDRQDIQDHIYNYLIVNTAVMSRAQLSGDVAVCSFYNSLFREEEKSLTAFQNRQENIRDKMSIWSGLTGVALGAVSLRRLIAQKVQLDKGSSSFGLPRAVSYAVKGRSDVIYYTKPTDIFKASSFQHFKAIGEGKKGHSEGAQLLAKATTKMLETLLEKIPEDVWLEKQEDLAVRQVVQTTLFRIQQHIATAIHKAQDFKSFTQALDRIHAEMTVFLELYKPFLPQDFIENYTSYLKDMYHLEGIEPAVGLGRSAMNIVSGVLSFIAESNPRAVWTCDKDSYYEEVEMLGGPRSLDQILQDPKVESVDLLVTEFYHNINIDSDHVHYSKTSVVDQVKRIFKEKPKTESLTLALDATIDFVRSEDLQNLLEEFQEEIQSGKLNIVVFRSGQKFDMLGYDNYFGGPFFVINNGDPKWDKFKKLHTHESFQTDQTSSQYFGLIAESGMDLTDAYKRIIFDNTRAVLEIVPEGLKPENSSEVCVCTADDGVLSPFIDIKIDCVDQGDKYDLMEWAQKRFMQIFLQNDKIVYRRGSFGFAHANFTNIDPKIRINPGLDGSELGLYKQFFQELEQKVLELKAKKGSDEK